MTDYLYFFHNQKDERWLELFNLHNITGKKLVILDKQSTFQNVHFVVQERSLQVEIKQEEMNIFDITSLEKCGLG